MFDGARTATGNCRGAVLRAFVAFHSLADVHGVVLAAVRKEDFYGSPPGIDWCQGRLKRRIDIAAASTMQATIATVSRECSDATTVVPLAKQLSAHTGLVPVQTSWEAPSDRSDSDELGLRRLQGPLAFDEAVRPDAKRHGRFSR